MDMEALVRFYEELTPASLDRFPEFYAEHAGFKDPFNEVRGVAAIRAIFEHMFRQVAEPRFVVLERLVGDHGAVLIWEFHFRAGLRAKGRARLIRGASHLRFGPDGRIACHRDYWDAAEELYMKLPVLGAVMRGLRRAFSADRFPPGPEGRA